MALTVPPLPPPPSLLHRLRLRLLEWFYPAPSCPLLHPAWDEAAAEEWLLLELRMLRGGWP